jgi:protein-tyrosine phosphatase
MVIAEIHSGQAPASVVVDIVNRLERGEVLLLPTDTVYGLHALARNREAVKRIRSLKGVEEDRPLSTLFSTVVGIGRFVQLPEGGYRSKILESWPGPVTWVLPAQPMMPKHILSPDSSLGIRIPNNQFLRSICAALDDLIVSTSANLHGDPPPTTQDAISREIMSGVDGSVFQLEPLEGRPSEVKRWSPGGAEILRTRSNPQTRSDRINFLFVCSGNTCRSPMAAGYLKSRVEKLMPGSVGVRSAGLVADEGMRASFQCIEVMRENGVDIHQHLSRRLSDELIDWADVILVMTHDQLDRVVDTFPYAAGLVHLMTTWPEADVSESADIPDPIGGNIEVYRETASLIEREIQRILKHLNQFWKYRERTCGPSCYSRWRHTA